MGRLGSSLAFSAFTPATGQELWKSEFPNYAISSHIGEGCGTASQIPRCTASDPIIGGTTTITCENIPTSSTAFLFLGFSTSNPLTLRPGCPVYMDFSRNPVVIDSWLQGGSGNHTTNFNIPAVAGLNGLELAVQLAIIPQSSSAISLSGGIELLLGSQ